MTPQERQLIAELFDRLASLESTPRDPDADAMIREGLRRTPNAPYALVQTVLVQDEALKAANARIQEYEQAYGAPQQGGEQPRGFLDTMRDNLFGRDEPRGSVPRVPQGGAPMGAPAGYNDPWGRGQGQGYQGQGYPMSQSAPMQQAPQQGGGGSFLGTAAAAAAGVIGGSILMGGIRSALGGHQSSSPAAGALDSLSGRGEERAPWGGGGGDLAREAGLGDIGRSGSGSGGGKGRRAGLFDSTNDSGDDTGYDAGNDDEGFFDESGDTE